MFGSSRVVGRATLVGALWLTFIGMAPRGSAQAPDSYESERVDVVLARAGLRLEPEPEGKTIAYVRIERRPVLEGDDLLVPIVLPRFAPTWPNRFHFLTEESTVARELLLHPGEPFRDELAEETMRNLRDLGIFALVRIVTVQTDDPDSVGVIVYTRDLWSLRLEQEFAGVGSTFALGLQLVERNFLGRNKALAARFYLDPFTYSVGQSYLDQRVMGGTLRLFESFDLILNRDSGRPEGGIGALRFGQPYYRLAQQFSFDVLASYAAFVFRDSSDGKVVGFDAGPGASFGTGCAQPGTEQCIARVWDERRLRLEGAVHHRIGERYKQTFTLGAGAVDRQVTANAETALLPGQAEVFVRDVLPRVRTEVFPFVRYRLFLPDFVVFTNLGTFGQSENVQVGPRLDGRIAVPLAALGSTRDAFVVQGLWGYTLAGHDALVDLSLEAASRLDATEVLDQVARLRLRAASPSFDFLLGRFVFRALLDARRNDTQNTFVTLGGDTGLRGYPIQHFFAYGANRWLANVEYRTKPLVLQSVHVGLVGFYDAGAVYRVLARSPLHHAAGAGLRVLFPQFNRYVFRLDGGVPLDQPGFAVTLSWGSDQAIPLTPAEDEIAASSGLAPR